MLTNDNKLRFLLENITIIEKNFVLLTRNEAILFMAMGMISSTALCRLNFYSSLNIQ